jgi:peptidoglycan DL-endopeptidase LytE
LKVFAKSMILSLSLLACGVFAAVHDAKAAELSPSVPKVQINDSLLQFPDSQPFVDEANRLQVPFSLISKKLGYEVKWELTPEKQVTVTLQNSSNLITLTTGANQAFINGNAVQLETPARFFQGRVYVPLRFISDVTKVNLDWNADNGIAILEADGQNHAPAWTEPKLPKQIVQTANGYLGIPYAWGGTTPKGFDCSGFVRFVFEQNGVNLPRTSREMFSTMGTYTGTPSVGDLVFFAQSNSTISHVGIYIGNNEFISATNDGVSIASMASKYWGSKYVGSKRVF